MMFAGSEKTEDKSYRSYRASLKEEDKKRLINAMIYWLYL